MDRLGKNHGRYSGETIDVRGVLHDLESSAQQHGWTLQIFHHTPEFEFPAFYRKPLSTLNVQRSNKIYLSAGVHGDEPAGPLAALRLLQENQWPANAELWLCPCLNPMGFVLNRRENPGGTDLNRDYRHLEAAEVRAHVAWLERQPAFDLCLLLHEDWESHGFYLYEQNPDNRPTLAETMIARVEQICPIDRSEKIEGRPANGGIIRPNLDPTKRPQWAEAFYLIMHKTRLSYTLEAPSDFSLGTRINALVTAVRAALAVFGPADPRV